MMARVVTGILAVVVLCGAVVAAGAIPVHVPAEPNVQHRNVTPSEQPVACPGPLEVPVGDISSGDDDLDSGSDDVQRDVFTTGSSDDAGGSVSSDAPIAATIERVGGGDIAGLAAVTCVRPSLSQWIVGGATSLGASARLVLTNPAEAPVEVTITAYGPIGAIEEPIVKVVGPTSAQEVLLEGTIPENPALTLQIDASGTGIVAAMQDSRLNGFEPAGTDWVGPAADPATSIVIPAVGPSVPDEEGGAATVVLMAPEGATAQLTLVTPDGIVEWPGTANLGLEPGVVTEIPVPTVDEGAVEVTADAPIVAAAVSRVARESQTGRGSAAYDTMWVAGQSAVSSELSLVAVTDSPELSVYSATHQEITVTNQAGDVVATRDIPARTVQRVQVDAVAGDILTMSQGVQWAQVVQTTGGFLTAAAPAATELSDLDIAVTVDTYIPAP
jgi:hypothetical protein